MFKQNSSFGKLPEGVNLVSSCPLCNEKYNPLQIKVLEDASDAHLVHITCAKCGAAVVALIVNSGMGITSVGLITDLTPEDVLKFRDTESVTSDDVLDMHEVLESKSNDYLKFFTE